jgi:hypothetical protein
VLPAGLVILHLHLLLRRLDDLTILRPGVILRWALGLLLVALLLGLRRLGVPLLHGRRALAFWLMVLMLHAGAGAPFETGLPAMPGPDDLLFVLPLGLTVLLLLAAGLVARGERIPARAPAPPRPRRLAGFRAPPLHPGFTHGLAPRAPPA